MHAGRSTLKAPQGKMTNSSASCVSIFWAFALLRKRVRSGRPTAGKGAGGPLGSEIAKEMLADGGLMTAFDVDLPGRSPAVATATDFVAATCARTTAFVTGTIGFALTRLSSSNCRGGGPAGGRGVKAASMFGGGGPGGGCGVKTVSGVVSVILPLFAQTFAIDRFGRRTFAGVDSGWLLSWVEGTRCAIAAAL